MINIGDKIKLIKTPCADCRVCKEAMSGYFEVIPGDWLTVDLPKSGIVHFDESVCEFELYTYSLENK